MIVFLVTAAGFEPLAAFLTGWANRLRGLVAVLTYDQLQGTRSLPGADAYVLADLERLDAEQLRAVRTLADELSTADWSPRVLNHPRRALLRHELLEMLHERGVNSHRAYRTALTARPSRFPVFLVAENRHDGPLTPLLHSQRELDRAAARAYLRRDDFGSLLTVEYEHAADADGVFRKYTMFVIGDELIPGNLAFSRDWVVKSAPDPTPEQLEEQRQAFDSHDHCEELGEVARLAGVDYGRFDYTLFDGRLCVWELNTNPTVALLPESYPEEARELRAANAERVAQAVERLGPSRSFLHPPFVPGEAAIPVFTEPHRRPRARRLLLPVAAAAPRAVLRFARRRQA